jgi:8-oxo-dGTP pyrophosphatase MutT (NUDIX family)
LSCGNLSIGNIVVAFPFTDLLIVVVAGLLLVAAALVVAKAVGAWTRPGRKWSSAGGILFDERGRIVLVRQRDRKGRWRWTLPKGRIDPGETAEEAALREVYEESGMRGRIVRPIALHEGRLHFTHFFEMTIERDDGIHDRETKEVRLVSLAEAADLLPSRRDRIILRRLVELRTRIVVSGR